MPRSSNTSGLGKLLNRAGNNWTAQALNSGVFSLLGERINDEQIGCSLGKVEWNENHTDAPEQILSFSS